MYSSELAEKISSLIKPLADSLSLSLWGIEVAIGPRGIVRIYVESRDGAGVNVDDCAELSRLAGLTLEVEDIIPCAYLLEVSSPGIERVFFTAEQLAGAVGKKVELSLLAPKPTFPGRRKFRGLLVERRSTVFTLLVEDSIRPGQEAPTLEFTFVELKKIRMVDDSFTPAPVAKTKKTSKTKNTTKEQDFPETAMPEEELRPLTPEEEELLRITGGSEAL